VSDLPPGLPFAGQGFKAALSAAVARACEVSGVLSSDVRPGADG
jgi:hypothetical protein